MHPQHRRPRPAPITLVAILLAAVVGACSSTASTPGPTGLPVSSGATAGASTGATGTRLSSPATVSIVAPTSGQTFTGSTVHIVITLTGAQIVAATTTNVRPDQGHVHLYVDNVLFSMNYGLEQDLPVKPGTYLLKAEFVGADHGPFSPRVWSSEVFFTVK